MIGIIKMLLSQAGIFGIIVGAIAMYFCKPLLDAAVKKLIGKNT